MNFGNFEYKRLILPFVLVIILIGIVWGYLSFQSQDSSENNGNGQEVILDEELLENMSPSVTTETDKETITVSGKTNSGDNKVSVNGGEAKVESDGTFKAEVPLNDGENNIFVEVTGSDNHFIQKNVKVTKKKATAGNGAEAPSSPGTPSKPEVPTANGEISDTGPIENFALALAALGFFGFMWFRSRNNLKNI